MKPTPIFSKILNEVIYLCPDRVSSLEVESQRKAVAYRPEEVEILREAEKAMNQKEYAAYLLKVHQVKKTFPGSTVQEFKESPPIEGQQKGGKEEEAMEPDTVNSLPSVEEDQEIGGLLLP